MKILKCMAIVLALTVVAGLGIYLCGESKETEKVQEAVMI